MLTFVIRVPYSPKGGGGPWPPCPHSGDAYDWLCRPCLLGVCSAGALQALPMVILYCPFLPHMIFGGAMVFI